MAQLLTGPAISHICVPGGSREDGSKEEAAVGADGADDRPAVKKRRWGSKSATGLTAPKPRKAISISTDSLKVWEKIGFRF